MRCAGPLLEVVVVIVLERIARGIAGRGQPSLFTKDPSWHTETMIERIPRSFRVAVSILGLCSFVAHSDTSLDTALKAQEKNQRAAAQSQRRIDALDEQTQDILAEYQSLLTEADQLEVYDQQLQRLVVSQDRELGTLKRQLEEIEVTKRRIVPLMQRMLGVLEEFVSLDAPFLERERRMRIDELKQLMDRADVALPEKYRRLIEAYQVETEYGYTIEAYRGALQQDGTTRTVDFLRLGRAGLYYLTFDHQESGYWDRQAGRWQVLPSSYRRALLEGLRIARKQAPPKLIDLPVSAPRDAP